MEPSVIKNGQYIYVRDVKKSLPGSIDVHCIMVVRSIAWDFRFCTCTLLFAITGLLILLLSQNTKSFSQVLMADKAVASVWSFTLAVFFMRKLLGKQVEKESVVILPAFGVQLETTYRSGKTDRHFVPIGKLLKPVLNECVTPVTCYWSLSLILRGEDALLLVFKELYPPATMLVPVWKALRAAMEGEECTDACSDCDTVTS